MTQYDGSAMAQEKKLLKELGSMKFSFRKLLKLIELDALVSYYNR